MSTRALSHCIYIIVSVRDCGGPPLVRGCRTHRNSVGDFYVFAKNIKNVIRFNIIYSKMFGFTFNVQEVDTCKSFMTKSFFYTAYAVLTQFRLLGHGLISVGRLGTIVYLTSYSIIH